MNDRLVQLKKELEKGQQQMALLEQRRQELRDTILRISGAIQVLEELQAQSAEAERDRQTASAAA
jgi:prefoldin subunit 5